MIGKIFRGYSAVLGSTIQFAALIGVCIGTGILLVYPLWHLAVRKPDVYTLVFCILLSILALIFTGFRIRTAARKGISYLLLAAARKGVLLAGIVAFVLFTLRHERALALLSLPGTIFFYGYLAFVISPRKKNPEGQ